MSDTVLSNFTQTVKEEREYGRKFKVAIIGTGWIAEAHAESYLAQPDVEIVALSDLIPGKAAAFAKQYGIENARIYGHHTEMLAAEKELDAVSVCTYNSQHAAPTICALEHGKDVLLEKPMCVTVEEAAAAMHGHPTLSEAYMEALTVLLGTGIHSMPAKKKK